MGQLACRCGVQPAAPGFRGDAQARREPSEGGRGGARPRVWFGTVAEHGIRRSHRPPLHRPGQFDAFDRALSRADRREPAHRSQPVLRWDVGPRDRRGVRPTLAVPPALRVRRPRDLVADSPGVGRMLVGAALVRRGPATVGGEDKEGPRAVHVAMRAQHDVHHLAGLVDGAVPVRPLPAHPHIGLVAPPPRPGAGRRPPSRAGQQRGALLHPVQDRPRGDVDPALRQQIAHVGGRETEAAIPAHRHHDDRLWPAVTGEGRAGARDG